MAAQVTAARCWSHFGKSAEGKLTPLQGVLAELPERLAAPAARRPLHGTRATAVARLPTAVTNGGSVDDRVALEGR